MFVYLWGFVAFSLALAFASVICSLGVWGSQEQWREGGFVLSVIVQLV
jgi:hypothetical protein